MKRIQQQSIDKVATFIYHLALQVKGDTIMHRDKTEEEKSNLKIGWVSSKTLGRIAKRNGVHDGVLAQMRRSGYLLKANRKGRYGVLLSKDYDFLKINSAEQAKEIATEILLQYNKYCKSRRDLAQKFKGKVGNQTRIKQSKPQKSEPTPTNVAQEDGRFIIVVNGRIVNEESSWRRISENVSEKVEYFQSPKSKIKKFATTKKAVEWVENNIQGLMDAEVSNGELVYHIAKISNTVTSKLVVNTTISKS